MRRDAVDLKPAELAEEDKRIGVDLTLGATDAQKEERLVRLHAFTKRMNWMAYAGAAAGGIWGLVEGNRLRESYTGGRVLAVITIALLLLLSKRERTGHRLVPAQDPRSGPGIS